MTPFETILVMLIVWIFLILMGLRQGPTFKAIGAIIGIFFAILLFQDGQSIPGLGILGVNIFVMFQAVREFD